MKVTKEMGVSHAEFFATLPRLFEGSDYRVQGSTVVHEQDGKRVTFVLGPEQQRAIARLTLTSTPVEMSLEGFDEAEEREFMQRFDLRFQRGGG